LRYYYVLSSASVWEQGDIIIIVRDITRGMNMRCGRAPYIWNPYYIACFET
jgi:hypothetical protein